MTIKNRLNWELNGIYALKTLFEVIRLLSQEEDNHNLIFKICDYAELLPEILVSNNQEKFQSYIEEIAKLNPLLSRVLDSFQRGPLDQWGTGH
jgi:hypothetical protein